MLIVATCLPNTLYCLHSNYFSIRRYRPILRPIFLIVRFYIFTFIDSDII